MNLQVARDTPEHSTFLSLLHQHGPCNFIQHVPQARTDLVERTPVHFADIASALASPACAPVIVTDAFSSWPAMAKWSFHFFKRHHGSAAVTVNNRAPARHADSQASGGGAQQTAVVNLQNYVEYMQEQPHTLEELHAVHCLGSTCALAPAPFYLNGWRAFSDLPSLEDDCPQPLFLSGVDHTDAILQAAVSAMLGRPAGAHLSWPSGAGSAVTNLKKVFMGPPGAITRLHFDAARAHGYLGQVVGRKLFVVYPPSDTPFLYRIAGETETEQSAVDPLDPGAVRRLPLYAHASPRAFVLHPGEAVVIPQGWWHYAVALDASITVMQNFYHAPSNAVGLVELVRQTAAATQTAKAARLQGASVHG